MDDRLQLPNAATVRSVQYYIAGFHGVMFIQFAVGVIQSQSDLWYWPAFFAVLAIASPFYIRWRYESPVFLSGFGVETSAKQIPWSAIVQIRIANSMYPVCIIKYEKEDSGEVERVAGIASPSEALPSQVLIRWQCAAGRDNVEKCWSLLRGHVVRNVDSA